MSSHMRCAMVLCLLALAMGESVAQTTAPPPAGTTARPAKATPNRMDARVEQLREYTVTRREEALQQARESAEELDRRIATLQQDLQGRWGTMNQDARARMDATMADLRMRRTRLAEWYGGMRHGSDQAWDEVRSGFIQSYHDLSDAFGRARAAFDEARKPARDEDKRAPSET